MEFNSREFLQQWYKEVQSEIAGINRELDNLDLEQARIRNRLRVYEHHSLIGLYKEEIDSQVQRLQDINQEAEALITKRTKVSKLENLLHITIDNFE
jgi:DNA repair ATPase RecN